MESIGKAIARVRKPEKAKPTTGGINSERAEVVAQVVSLMREPNDQKRFRYWLGRTKKLPPNEIYQLVRLAKDGRNPAALFNHLLKNYGKKEQA